MMTIRKLALIPLFCLMSATAFAEGGADRLKEWHAKFAQRQEQANGQLELAQQKTDDTQNKTLNPGNTTTAQDPTAAISELAQP